LLGRREACDAESLVVLLTKIPAANPGKRLLVVLDNVPCNKAPVVQKAAAALRLQLLYLQTYSPNLNLIERLRSYSSARWRTPFLPNIRDFRVAVQHFLDNLDKYRDGLALLKTECFQLFTAA
jgi:hypothetical protein